MSLIHWQQGKKCRCLYITLKFNTGWSGIKKGGSENSLQMPLNWLNCLGAVLETKRSSFGE